MLDPANIVNNVFLFWQQCCTALLIQQCWNNVVTRSMNNHHPICLIDTCLSWCYTIFETDMNNIIGSSMDITRYTPVTPLFSQYCCNNLRNLDKIIVVRGCYVMFISEYAFIASLSRTDVWINYSCCYMLTATKRIVACRSVGLNALVAIHH